MLSDINLLRVKEKWKTYSADIPKAGGVVVVVVVCVCVCAYAL